MRLTYYEKTNVIELSRIFIVNIIKVDCFDND